MTYQESDLRELTARAESLKGLTTAIVSSTSEKDCLQHHQDCTACHSELTKVDHHYDKLLREQRRIKADFLEKHRREVEEIEAKQNEIKLLKMEMKSHASMAKDHKWDLWNERRSLNV